MDRKKGNIKCIRRLYNKLPTFLCVVMHFSLGIIALFDVEADVTKPNTFVCKRVWWVFKPMIDGWHHPRPIINIDGTFLKEKYKGKLFVAIRSYSNNQQHLIAYNLVHEELIINWFWLLYYLQIYLCQRIVCIIFDRYPRITEVMKRVESGFAGEWGIHRFLLLFIHSNFYLTSQVHIWRCCNWVADNISQVMEIWSSNDTN